MAEPVVTCTIAGLDKIQAELERLGLPMAKKILKASLQEGAAPILAEMQREAPEDTGFLDHHFNVKLSIKGREIAGAAYVGPQGHMDYPLRGGRYKDKINSRGKTYKSGRISVTAVARFFEYGTEKMPAYPFMSRSFIRQKENALYKIIAAMKRLIFQDRS